MLHATAGIGRDLVSALSRRAGTLLSGFLVSQGVPEDLAHQLYLATAVVAALAFDATVYIIQKRKVL